VALTKVTGNGLGAFTQDGAAVFNESSADTDFRIESNGNANMLVVDAGTDKIGIGTAAPTVTLEVANASNPALSGVTNRNPIIQLTNTDTGYVAGNATAIDFATSLNYTNASIICRNDNSGSGFGGSLIFATSPTSGNSLTERMRILPTGGLTFNGDTATANALDDYEEGTFTPVFQQGLTSAGYSTQTGTYIKIGRQVICSIQLRANSGTENSSHIYVGGLPFTITNDVDHSFGAFWTYNGGFWTSSANTSFLGLRNTTNLAFYKQVDGGAIVGTNSDVAANLNADLRIVVVYRAD